MDTWPTLSGIKEVVLVADMVSGTDKIDIGQRVDLEQTQPNTLALLLSAFSELGVSSHVYETPAELADHAMRHSNATVLSIYGGSRSRNRMALVPAICETYDLDFIGPDTYGRIICQDKSVSTDLAAEAGFRVPNQRLFRSVEEFNIIETIDTPYVLKPLLEGSSIGITERNLVRQSSVGHTLLCELFNQFAQPVLLEEFVPGREVSLNFIELKGQTLWAFSEIKIPNAPDYFDTHLFDADEKFHHRTDRQVVTIDEERPDGLLESAEKLLTMIGAIGYGRIDGKLINQEFVFLELTPDAWIAPTGAFAASFTNLKQSYSDVIAAVLMSNRANPRGQIASG